MVALLFFFTATVRFAPFLPSGVMGSSQDLTSDYQPDRPAIDSVDECIRLAQGGCAESLGQLYERCRRYLLLIANQELDSELRAKLGPSDLVQETLLAAQRGFGRFEGRTDAELRAWLRRILLNQVSGSIHHYGVAKRDVRRERELEEILHDQRYAAYLADDCETPSKGVIESERREALAIALRQLPKHYRQALISRNFDGQSFVEIGLDMDLTEAAARKLWLRAISALRKALETGHDSI